MRRAKFKATEIHHAQLIHYFMNEAVSLGRRCVLRCLFARSGFLGRWASRYMDHSGGFLFTRSYAPAVYKWTLCSIQTRAVRGHSSLCGDSGLNIRRPMSWPRELQGRPFPAPRLGRLRRSDRQHRTRAQPGDLIRDRAEEQMAQAAMTLRRHDHQVGVFFFGYGGDLLGNGTENDALGDAARLSLGSPGSALRIAPVEFASDKTRSTGQVLPLSSTSASSSV